MRDQRDRLLAALDRAYRGPLARFFQRRARSPADVPDLVQDVFLRLSRMPDPAAIENPEQFIFVTAANVLRDRARRDAARSSAAHEPLDGHDPEGSDFAPDRVLDGRGAVARIETVLRALPDRTRDVFVLRVLEGMRMADVARAIGISTRAAEKHQAKALARLADALEAWRRD